MVLRCPVLPFQLQLGILLLGPRHAGLSLLPMNHRNSDSRANELGIHDVFECRGDLLLLRFRILLLLLGIPGLVEMVLGSETGLDHWTLLVLAGVPRTLDASFRILRGAPVCMSKFRASRRQWGRVQ